MWKSAWSARRGKNDAGVPLHEAWATTHESGNHLYDLVVVDFPTKMPVGVAIREKGSSPATSSRFKATSPAAAKPGQPPERAPLLIGRLDWNPTAAPAETGIWPDWIWDVAALAFLVLMWGGEHSSSATARKDVSRSEHS